MRLNKIILITRPKYDILTNYLFYFTKEIINKAQEKQIKILNLRSEKATKKYLLSYIKKFSPGLINFNGHGNEEVITGQNEEILLNEENLDLVKKTIVYSLTCDSAKKLGYKAVENGCYCFVGYKDKFILVYNKKYITKPLNDKLAFLFLNPSNIFVISIIKGLSTKNSYLKSRSYMIKNFIYMISSKASREENEAASFLWFNIKNQIIIGDKKIKLYENY